MVARGIVYQWWTLGKVVVIVGLIVGIGILTWFKGINYVRAAVIADQAASEFQAGRLQSSLSSMDQAIDLAPDVSSYHEHQNEIYTVNRNSGASALHLNCSSLVGVRSKEVCLAEEEYEDATEWVARRPFAFRSRLAQANSAKRLASMKRDSFLAIETIRLYEETAQMVPNSFIGWNRVASANIFFGQSAESLQHIEKSMAIVRDGPESAIVLVLQAEAYHNLGRTQQELESLIEATTRFPSFAEPYYLRGGIYRNEGQFERSIEQFDKAIGLNPVDAQYWYVRGETYHELGRHKEAIEDLDQAVSLDPQHAAGYNTRGLVYTDLGEFERAVGDFGFAIGINPGFAVAYNNRGLVYRQFGDLNMAIDDFSQAIRLDPRYASAYYDRALAYTQLGRDAEAQQDAERAAQLGFDQATLSSAIDELKNSR